MTDLAAALLRDVPLHDSHHDHGGWMYRTDVLAALSRALDGVNIVPHAAHLSQLATEIGEIGRDLGWHRVWERADAMQPHITALLAQNAALRAERDTALGMYLRSSDEGFRQKARADTAEAEVEKLRGALDNIATELTGVTPEPDNMRMAIDTAVSVARAALTTEADNA